MKTKRNYITPSDRRVLPALRQGLQKQHHLTEDSPHWPMMQFLLWRAVHDKDGEGNSTGRLVLSEDVLWGLYPKYAGNEKMASTVTRFERDTGLHLDFQVSTPYGQRASTIRLDLDKGIQDLRDQDMQADLDARTVYFLSGRKVTDRTKRQQNKLIKQENLNKMIEAGIQTESSEVLDYVNQLADYVGRQTRDAVEPLKHLVATMPETLSKDATRRVIAGIEHNPQQVYRSKEHTARVFAQGCSVNLLPREFRKFLLSCFDTDGQGKVWELDLAHAHLAIVAKLWELPRTTALLEQAHTTSSSAWSDFLDYLELDGAYKSTIKTNILPIIYGIGKRKLKDRFIHGSMASNRFIKGVGDPEIYEAFLTHPVVDELLTARTKVFRELERSRGGYDAYGNRIERYKNGRFHAPSTMSSIAQSYEKRIMAALVAKVRTYRRVYLLSWLHDGATFLFGDSSKMHSQIRGLQRAVDDAAQDLGIHTHLEASILDRAETEADAKRYVQDAILHSAQNSS